jgi:hypothetical protein
MGRRTRGCRPIGRILIILGNHQEPFDLQQETLVDRDAAIARARSLHDLAMDFLQNPHDFVFPTLEMPADVQIPPPRVLGQDPSLANEPELQAAGNIDGPAHESTPASWDAYFAEYPELNW